MLTAFMANRTKLLIILDNLTSLTFFSSAKGRLMVLFLLVYSLTRNIEILGEIEGKEEVECLFT